MVNFRILRLFLFGLCFTYFQLFSEIKETQQIIEEWIDTEHLISQESTQWKSEKAALVDLQDALTRELLELQEKLKLFEEEASGAAQQRSELMERKEKAENTTQSLIRGLQKIEQQVAEIFSFLPTPLAERLSPFLKKLEDGPQKARLTLRQRVEAIVSLLQSIHLFHRTVTLERQEFTLDDDKSREFMVLYFGLGAAYFVNESGTVSGYGLPSNTGWIWTRKDDIAREVTTGVQMMNNQAMPRFLELPLPAPNQLTR
jgi:hypothetical protein|tara:strand:- start:2322 stop:3095 length:774 start_codon:yes stop_codon:yes gene_type:complete